MYTFILFAGLGLIVGFLVLYLMEGDVFEALGGAVGGIIIGGIIGVFLTFLLPSKLIEQRTTEKMVCLQDNTGSEGRFFLGSGYVGSEMKYVYYAETSPGLFEMKQLKYDNTKIKYTPDSTAFVEVYKKIYDPNYKWNDWSADSDYGDTRYVINVPKGTIKTNFQLDAQ